MQAVERLQNTVTAANNSGAQTVYSANRTTNGLTDVAAIGGTITDISASAYKGGLVFSTANNAAPAERMRIDANGNVGIGTSAPRTALDLSSRTDAIALPSGTSGQQPTSPVAGWMRYNSTTNTIEFYNGSIWTAASNAVDPAGMIGAFPMSSCPSGWLEANGAAVSRTTYSSLFTAIGTSYGPGDGSTTFNLPDYRGYFLRGWNHGASNDPDASSRTNRGDSTTGDNVGTKQADQYGTHSHNLGQSFSATIFGWATSTGATAGWVTAGSTATSSSGGNETRPKNINVTYCVSTASIQAVTTASSGSGTTNYLPQWTSSTALGISPIAVSGSNVGISSTAPSQSLDVNGKIASTNLRQFVSFNNAVSTTSTAWVDLPNMTQTVTGSGLPVTIIVNLNGIWNTDAGPVEHFQLLVDGTTVANSAIQNDTRSNSVSTQLHWLQTLSPGSHTIKVQWRVSSGTGEVSWASSQRSILIFE
jgi:microcystin-dependent protein